MYKKKSFFVFTLVLGLCLAVASIFIKGEELKAVSGIMIGIGSGLFGMSVANLMMKRMEEKNPRLAKQNEIEFKDERNTEIRNRAKAKAGDITQYLIMGIAYITILINAPLWVTLATVGVFLVYNVLGIYYMQKYNKE